MPIPTNPTKADIDQFVTTVISRLRSAFSDANDLKTFLDSKSEFELVALGYTAPQATKLKSAFSDMDLFNSIINGSVNIPSRDFRMFLRQLNELGSLP